MKALKKFLIGLAVIGSVSVGMISSAAERKADSDKRMTGTTNTFQPKVNAQPQTSPISPASQTKVNQAQPSTMQPVTTEPAVQPALKAPLTGEQIKWQVMSGGGNRSTSTNFILSSTLGQTAAGPSASTNYKINSGFWQNFLGGGCCAALSVDGRTGNVDGDIGKGVDISDLSALIDFLYISFTPPLCMQSANIDGDNQGGVDISDLSGLIDFLYISFTPPALCQ